MKPYQDLWYPDHIPDWEGRFGGMTEKAEFPETANSLLLDYRWTKSSINMAGSPTTV